MSQNLTVSLVATALQKLEAIQHSEAEVLSDDECRARAEEVAKAALEAIAICTKYLISRNAEAHIDGIGNFYLQHDHIRFAPDDDMVQYALLKEQKPELQQRALRNALVKSLSVARAIIPALQLASGEHEQDVVGVDTPEEQLLKTIFGETAQNRFGVTVSKLVNTIIDELREAGIRVETSPASVEKNLEVEVEVEGEGEMKRVKWFESANLTPSRQREPMSVRDLLKAAEKRKKSITREKGTLNE
jgi:hypothetical protein